MIIRGIERKEIFRDKADKENFIVRLAQLIPETLTSCNASVLMTNHYGRCDAVQNVIYFLVNEGVNIDGERIIRDNSALSREVILATVKHANEKLWQECKTFKKWPHEI